MDINTALEYDQRARLQKEVDGEAEALGEVAMKLVMFLAFLALAYLFICVAFGFCGVVQYGPGIMEPGTATYERYRWVMWFWQELARLKG